MGWEKKFQTGKSFVIKQHKDVPIELKSKGKGPFTVIMNKSKARRVYFLGPDSVFDVSSIHAVKYFQACPLKLMRIST